MALGKIKADTLEHSTAGSLDTSYVVNGSEGLVKSQYVWNNGTGKFEHCLIHDNATGDHSMTVTSAFSSADYCWAYGGKRASGDGTNCFDAAVIRSVNPTSTVTRHSLKTRQHQRCRCRTSVRHVYGRPSIMQTPEFQGTHLFDQTMLGKGKPRRCTVRLSCSV